jgi:hypothetical protein
VSTETSEASLAYVSADGSPLDMTQWVTTNAWMAAVPAIGVALGFLSEADHTSVRAGLQLGAFVTLAAACASRVWTLLHDRRHRTATRSWWEAHHAQTRRRSLALALTTLAALAAAFAMSLSRDQDFVAAATLGPAVGALFVLACCGESVRLRRARGRPEQSGPRRL